MTYPATHPGVPSEPARSALIDRLLGLSLVRLAAVLLLSAITLQATAPVTAIELTHGSAFSATTFETALIRRASTPVTVAAPLPALPPTEVVVRRGEPDVSVTVPRMERPQAPPVPILAFLPGPRAPPSAA